MPEKFNFKKDYHTANDSEYIFSSDFTQAGRIGATGSPQTPNQIGELTSRLNQGLKAVEVGTMNQRLMDQIPAEHFVEMKRLAELTGSKASLHAPIQDLDLAGFTQQGWNDFERKENIEKLKSVIDRAHLLDNKGNIPITVHAGGFPAQKWKKEGLHGEWEDESGHQSYVINEGKSEAIDTRSEMIIVNQDTGQMQGVKYDTKEYITGEKQAWTPERRMNNLNQTSWDHEQLQLLQMKKDFNQVLDRFNALYKEETDALEAAKKKKLLTDTEVRRLAQLEQEQKNMEQYREEIHSQTRSMAEEMYSRFNKYGSKAEAMNPQEEMLQKNFKENMKIISQEQKNIDELKAKAKKLSDEFRSARESRNLERIEDVNKKFGKVRMELDDAYYNQTELLVRNFENMPAPNTWVAADDFAKEKVSDSVAEAALHAYKEYGEKAPIISMENVYPEFTLSRADSLRDAIEKSRDKFAKGLVSNKELKVSEKKAKEIAEKLIGVTWDVGHIYMLRKHGYTDEDIRKEAKKIAKYVKHVHLTDNFGFEDSHLPPGEGSVNIKEQLEEIKKALSKGDLEKINSIVEAGEFVANFKETPHLYALSHLDSPFYSDRSAPYWKNIWDTPSGNYFIGSGETMPQKYFDLYGAPGFSQLPPSLGGTGGSNDRGRLASSEES